jgi:hypothetical protein
MCRFEYPAEGLTRYIHPDSGVLLIKALEISQAHRLKLIDAQVDVLKDRQGNSSRLEVAALRQMTHSSVIKRPGH